MSNEWTAEEVRRAIQLFAGYSATHHGIGGELMDIATAYAERIEADGSAVPTFSRSDVAKWRNNAFENAAEIVDRYAEYFPEITVAADDIRALITHPPAQAAQVNAPPGGVLHAIDRADTALCMAGLSESDIFRVELKQAREVIATMRTAEPVAQGESASGTFDCPICGVVTVHYHSASEVCAWAAAQANRFLISLGHPEIVMRTKDEDEQRTSDFRKRVADVEEMLRDAGHSYQAEYARLAAQPRAVPDSWRRALERALPFLDDEAIKYEDDSNNEPLDVADTIRDLLAAAPQPGES